MIRSKKVRCFDILSRNISQLIYSILLMKENGSLNSHSESEGKHMAHLITAFLLSFHYFRRTSDNLKKYFR